MANLAELPLTDKRGLYRAVIETPRGETRKIDYDRELECFFIKRRLPLGMAYPFHFGFLPSTLGEDGDPLDAIVLSADPTFASLTVSSRLIGALTVKQKDAGEKALRNDRFIMVPKNDFENGRMRDIADVPNERRAEIEDFLTGSVKLEKKKLAFLGWVSARQAAVLIEKGAKTFRRDEKKNA
jgi:inorganic pyrophosphatase